MKRKGIIILLSILLGVMISGCNQQINNVKKTESEEQARQMVEQAEGKSYKVDHEAEESYEAREQEKVEKAMDITLKDAKKEEVVDSKIKLLQEKYNGKSYSEVEAIDGWLNDIHDIENQGYVFICYNKKYNIMDKESATKLAESVYEKDVTGDGFGGMTTITQDFVKGIEDKYKKKKAQVQAEDFSKLVKSHLKEGSGVASIENDMNTFGYTINNLGYVVQNEQAVNYMKSLRGDQYNLYRQTEMEAFKRNNYGKVNIVNKSGMSTNYSEGTFDNQGNPLWVCREANFGTTNAVGEKIYANVNYGYEEFREYCGGTSIAFKGWGDTKNDPKAQKSWCDTHNLLDKNLGQFVDWCWDWTGDVGVRSFKKIG